MSKENVLIEPLTVQVLFSESSIFREDGIYSYAEFEERALKVALSNPLGGYDKTDILVTFDNQTTYSCRLDLGCRGNDTGFSCHALSILNLPDDAIYNSCNSDAVEFLKKFRFSEEVVEHRRAKAAEAERKAIARKELMRQERVKQEVERLKREDMKLRIFRSSLDIPDWAQSAIIATKYELTECCVELGERYYSPKKTLLLSWSKHQRCIFSELRKAAKNHSDTEFLADKANGIEHRCKHTNGGPCLTEPSHSQSGWYIRKFNFYNLNRKPNYIPMAEVCIPSHKQ